MLVCLTVYIEKTSAANISIACSTSMNGKPLPGSSITRLVWRGRGMMPSVTPSAPRFFVALALPSAFSRARSSFDFFALGAASSSRRTTM